MARPDLSQNTKHRLLLITYHFPPSREVGALRWEKLAMHAAERGWGIDAFVADPATLAAADPERLHDLPKTTRVYGIGETPGPLDRFNEVVVRLLHALRHMWRSGIVRSRSRTPTAIHIETFLFSRAHRWRGLKVRDWIQAFNAVARYQRYCRWAASAAEAAIRAFNPDVHLAVISSGPPHMAHLAGKRVSATTGLPLVVDMRDPWSLVERLPENYASPVWTWLARRDEPRTLERAILVVCNTFEAEEGLCSRYPQHAEKLVTIMNGYDEDPLPEPCHHAQFLIAYAGSIYLDRTPKLLFRAAVRVVKEMGLTPSQFSIEFLGDLPSLDAVLAVAESEGLDGFVRVWPTRPRKEVLRFLSTAAMLVVLPQDSYMAIPAKTFEYMRFSAWILGLAEKGTATERVLRRCGADIAEPMDVDAIAAILRARYRQFAAGEQPPPLCNDRQLSRRYQAQKLFDEMVKRLANGPKLGECNVPGMDGTNSCTG
jgi:glycosyltransferase involved in cell wall biosynthesis